MLASEGWAAALGKLATAYWFAKRPSHWAHAAELGFRRLRPGRDGREDARRAGAWAEARAVSVTEALRGVGLLGVDEPAPHLPDDVLAAAEQRAASSPVVMGGAGDLDVLYAAVVCSGAQRVVETGVGYGWSSLAILSALSSGERGLLVSVDMAYPKLGNEEFVGIAVPDELRGHWELIREPDRRGLRKAIARQGGELDLCHYDSDKTWQGRRYAYPRMWDALRPGGVFVSDDVNDNLAFAEFVDQRGVGYVVTEYGGKYVGIVRKPGATDDG